jgi:hypothetical protein
MYGYILNILDDAGSLAPLIKTRRVVGITYKMIKKSLIFSSK